MDRRQAIHRITRVLGGALSAPTLAGLVSGCEARSVEQTFVPRTLDSSRLRAVALLADVIIPETDTPGASDAGVHRFIDDMLTDFFPEDLRTAFTAGLDRLEARCRSHFDTGLVEATDVQRAKLVEALDREAFPPDGARSEDGAEADAPRFWPLMKELTVSGYYTSEVGTTLELHVPPFGPFQADIHVDQVGRTWA